MHASIVAVSLSPRHSFSKPTRTSIRLVEGLGVEGDAHHGRTTQHRHQARLNPAAPNLRQAHLIHAELFDELRARGFDVGPGEMGENVTTRGVDLLALPSGTRLRLGRDAIVELTGLRHPCKYIDAFRPGLRAAVMDTDADGGLIRKSGVMAVVIAGGEARPGDAIRVDLPDGERRPLRPV